MPVFKHTHSLSHLFSSLPKIEKVSELYAKLLGHQNQRQKIQHVKKLKEDNWSLKQVGKSETQSGNLLALSLLLFFP